jgi:hypothetical protein
MNSADGSCLAAHDDGDSACAIAVVMHARHKHAVGTAQAAMTPSGVPPIPMSTSTPEFGVAATSPSVRNNTRAPDWRISEISCWWRGLFNTNTVRLRRGLHKAAAVADNISGTGADKSPR